MMKHYIGTKFINAEPEIKDRINSPDTSYMVEPGFRPDDEWLRTHGFDPDHYQIIEGIEGYRVEYPDGYVSWSPKDTFEKAYHELKAGVSFSDALTAMKNGFTMGRRCWLGKVVVMRMGYTAIPLNTGTCEAHKIPNGTVGNIAPYLQVREGHTFQVYIPTMDDLMAEDWYWIVPSDNESNFGMLPHTAEEGTANE